jgi:hypothetical protein
LIFPSFESSTYELEMKVEDDDSALSGENKSDTLWFNIKITYILVEEGKEK